MEYPKDFQNHIVGVGGIVIHENDRSREILLVKVSYGETRFSFVLPGGFVEVGETLEEAVIREIKEETNVDVEPIGIVGIRTMVQDPHRISDIYVTFLCKVTSEVELAAQEEEILEVVWIPYSKVESNDAITPFTRYTINQVFRRQIMDRDHKVSDERWKQKRLVKNEQYWNPLL